MNALDLVHELTVQNVRVEIRGDRLSLEGHPGVLTDELTERLRQHKAELLVLYGRRVHGVSMAKLRELAGDDWSKLESSAELLEAFATTIQVRWMRERGEVPPEYTQAARCAACGPIYLWEGAPERVEACPWCFNRIRGLPVPCVANLTGPRVHQV